MHILLGSANHNLTDSIIKSYEENESFKNYITVQKVFHKYFPDGENYIRVDEQFIYNEDVCILQSMVTDSSIIELMMIVDAVSRLRPRSISLFIPYFAYSRQDRILIRGEPISSNMIARIISEYHPIKMINLLDVHSHNMTNIYRNCYVNNITLSDVFAKVLKPFLKEKHVVVAPDFGAMNRNRDLARLIKSDVAVVEKMRDAKGRSKSLSIIGDISGKDCIIHDDIVDSAGTLCNAVRMLKEQGAKSVYACITHPIFSGNAVSNIDDSYIDTIFVTNTVKLNENAIQSKKIKVLDISNHILSSIINCL